jgi:hypothetical protein
MFFLHDNETTLTLHFAIFKFRCSVFSTHNNTSDKENIMAVRKAAAKAKSAPAVETEELETAEVTEEKAPKQEVTFGTRQLADHINAETGSSYDSYALRVVLRKMTKDGILERSEADSRSRYSFTGPEDPQVQKIVTALQEGYGEKAKQERLDELKAKREAGATKKKPAARKAKAAKTEAPEVVEDEDLEIEDL